MSDTSSATVTSIESTGRAIIARPQMKLMDDNALKSLEQRVEEAAAANPGVQLVILDLARVAVLPSLALGLLVRMADKCHARDQELKLVGLQPPVRRVFAITRLDRVFQLADSVEAAID